MKSSQKIDHFKKLLSEEKLDGVLVSSVFNITHLTGYSNFSSEEREAHILITKTSQFILTDGRYSEAVLKQVPEFGLVLISSEKPFIKHLESLVKKHKIKKLGIEEDDLRVSEHKRIKKVIKNLKHVDLKRFRSIKRDDEIEKIKKACKLGDEVFTHVIKKVLKNGISEKEAANEIENYLKKKSSKISFEPIVAFGANSSVPHHESGDKKLEKGFVLLDLGAKFENYSSDMTRTVFWGKANEKQKKIYRVVKEAQEKAVEYVNNSKGKIRTSKVDKVARDYIIAEGFGSIPHSLGHGIGLLVHEHPYLSPKSKEVLKPGMVFSIEPGIYIPQFGGVRIEDLYLLTKKGLEKLTKSPSNLLELI